MLRVPGRAVGVVPAWAAGAAALAAGAGLLALGREAQRRALLEQKMSVDKPLDGVYRRPDYPAMSSEELQRVEAVMDSMEQDYAIEPLTQTLYERDEIKRERERRSGGGGDFAFIAPSAPAAFSLWQALAAGTLALGAGIAAALAQAWGYLNGRETNPVGGSEWWAPESGPVYPRVMCVVGPGDYVRCASNSLSTEDTLSVQRVPWFADPAKEQFIGSVYKPDGTAFDFCVAVGAVDGRCLEFPKGEYTVEVRTIKPDGPEVTPSEGPLTDPIPMPEPEPLPEGDPELEPLPLPEPVPPPKPLAPPATDPGTQPSPDPQPPGTPAPGPGVTPVPVPVPVPSPTPVPLPPAPETSPKPTLPDGTLKPDPPKAPPTTSPDDHFPVPGGKPITGNGPAPKPEEIAKELGRLENKLNVLLNPVQITPDWVEILTKLAEAIFALNSGTTYTLTEPCPLEPGEVAKSIDVEVPGGLTTFQALLRRHDALAELLQAHKDLRQPTCSVKPQLTGEWVTVNFKSDEKSPMGDKPLRKYLRYRDQTYADQETHVSHWEKFVWQAGPVWVASKNLSWGTPSCWAATAEEGKRVLSHAAQVAGVDLTDPKHEWVISGSNDPRYGQPGTMRVDTRGGRFVRVTKRPGPNGLPIGRPPKS